MSALVARKRSCGPACGSTTLGAVRLGWVWVAAIVGQSVDCDLLRSQGQRRSVRVLMDGRVFASPSLWISTLKEPCPGLPVRVPGGHNALGGPHLRGGLNLVELGLPGAQFLGALVIATGPLSAPEPVVQRGLVQPGGSCGGFETAP